MNLVVTEMEPSDREFALEAFRAWALDCHGFRGERAWEAMADLASSRCSHLETVAVRDGGSVVAFLVVSTDPAAFWQLFLSRLGHGALLSRMLEAAGRSLRNVFSGVNREPPEQPVDEEFIRLSRQSAKTRPGVAWGLFSYVEPRYRRPPTALLMYGRMFQRLRDEGFTRLEGQIRFGNEESVGFHRALGYDVRNAGVCFHAVKDLTTGEAPPDRLSKHRPGARLGDTPQSWRPEPPRATDDADLNG